MALMSIGKFAKEVDLSLTTLRQMHKTGELIPCYISSKGTRYYSEEQLDAFINKSRPQTEKPVAGYCRVSTKQQKDDLETQISNVQKYMSAKGYTFSIIQDIGSGINYKKPGLQKLIQQVNNQEISKIVVLYKDRLMRFGFEMFEHFCALNHVDIEIIDNTQELSREQELTDDLIQIITVFANRLYGQRSRKTKELVGSVKNIMETPDGTD